LGGMMNVINFDFRKKRYRTPDTKEHIIFDIINEGNLNKFISYIENNRFDFTITDYNRRTILHHSIIKNKWEIAMYILKFNLVDINAKTLTGATAFDFAIAYKDARLIGILLEYNPEYDQELNSMIGDILGIFL
jgi:ankyrin repeat protein